MSSRLEEDVRRGLQWTVAAGLAVQGGRLLLLLALARLWPREAFGQAALIFTVINFGLFFVDLGMSNALLSRPVPARRVISTLFWACVLAGTILTILVIALRGWLADVFNEPALRYGLLLAAPQLVAEAIGMPQRVLWRKALLFKALAYLEVTSFILQAIITVALAHRGVEGMMWGKLADHVLIAAATLIWSAREWRPRWEFDLAALRDYRAFGLYQLGDRALTYIAQRVDTVLIGRTLGSAMLGPYDVVKQMLARPESIINPMATQVATPIMAQHRDEPSVVGDIYARMVGALAAIQFPLYAFLGVVAGTLLPLLLGPSMGENVAMFRWLAVYYALHITFNPVGALLLAVGAVWRAFWWNLMLLGGFALATTVGMQGGTAGVGAALAGLYALLQLPFYRWFIRPLTGLTPAGYFSVFMRPLAAALAAALATGFAMRVLPENIVGLIVAAIVHFVAYVSASWVMNREFVHDIRVFLRRG